MLYEGVAVLSGWRNRIEDAMAVRAERPEKFRQLDRIMRNFTVGGVIATGAVLWGYAIYHVAIRTL
jgi:hypothetical protein